MRSVALFLVLLMPVAAQKPVATSKIAADMRPIRKVITLLQEMKATCEKEAAEDLAAYEKYSCWCETNEKEKVAAIEIAEQRIADLDTFIETATAKAGELKTEIAGLAQDIADDREAIDTATGIRNKENEAFLAEEADMKETRYLLDEAVKTLKKVQLLQKGSDHSVDAAAHTALVQLRDHVQKRFPNFFGTMQRDLFDMLSSFHDVSAHRPTNLRRQAAFDQANAEFRSTTLLPWQKTEEQIGMEANPNDLVGMAAGAKSYNSRSGKILGILAEMHDEFSRDLGAAQKAELEALIAFSQLRAAKLMEIEEATKLKEEKEAQLADTLDKIAKAKEDKAATEAALAADQKFLANLRKSCKEEDEQYQARYKVRSDEIVALTETLRILTADDARDLYDNTMSFLEVNTAARVAAQDHAKERVMFRLAEVAKRHKNWMLASLAVRVRLDAFTKVKKAMDKMMAELEKQQKEEYAKWEQCKADIDKTEDDIKVGVNVKKDLAAKHLQLSNTIATLKDDIARLKQEVADMEVQLKEAGEQRKAENELFQTSISDQRATINILQKALTRLRAFYGFAQTNGSQEPGAAAPPPPPKPSSKSYEKSGLSGGVVQMLMKIIEDSEAAEGVLKVSEQHAQGLYAGYVRDTTAAIEANRDLIEEKEGQVATTEAAKAETEEAQSANDQELATLRELLAAHHLDCDYIIKYFNVRQKARAEEMDAITDAKAILSGADFQ